MNLVEKKCKPCEGGVEPLARAVAEDLCQELHADWELSDDAHSISRLFSFKVFSRTIAFVNAVAFVATNEGHHPEMLVDYGSCKVTFTTNAIEGLSENDFICAAKIDQLARQM